MNFYFQTRYLDILQKQTKIGRRETKLKTVSACSILNFTWIILKENWIDSILSISCSLWDRIVWCCWGIMPPVSSIWKQNLLFLSLLISAEIQLQVSPSFSLCITHEISLMLDENNCYNNCATNNIAIMHFTIGFIHLELHIVPLHRLCECEAEVCPDMLFNVIWKTDSIFSTQFAVSLVIWKICLFFP